MPTIKVSLSKVPTIHWHIQPRSHLPRWSTMTLARFSVLTVITQGDILFFLITQSSWSRLSCGPTEAKLSKWAKYEVCRKVERDRPLSIVITRHPMHFKPQITLHWGNYGYIWRGNMCHPWAYNLKKIKVASWSRRPIEAVAGWWREPLAHFHGSSTFHSLVWKRKWRGEWWIRVDASLHPPSFQSRKWEEQRWMHP